MTNEKEYDKRKRNMINEKLSGSIKFGEFLDWLRNCQLLKDCAVWIR
jgi:hypothetical protein